MKRYLRDYSFLFLISGLVVALDQWTKYLVRMNLELSETWVPWKWLEPYARIIHWKNTGVAFGMFQDRNALFIVLALAVSFAIIYYFPRVEPEDRLMRFALALQLGGALGNVFDRILIGHVVDFLSVGTFPVLNLADASISAGVGLLVLGIWIQDRNDKKAMKAEMTAAPADEAAGPGDRTD